VNLRWTDFTLFTSPTECDDQTQDVYSSTDLTYAVQACIKVGGSVDAKHLCIKFATMCARVFK